ncbi:pectate lyase superfamily protein-domain-containing protein [Aspergillus pseudoustus]|uniref:Pectate lyase superfamily protein-domain-containing protein n=1 Tax=Aspergillus pseudoustus TaxID=1810923 RepID=A0ABR4KHH7_9EURO
MVSRTEGLVAPRQAETHPILHSLDNFDLRQPLLVNATVSSINEAREIVRRRESSLSPLLNITPAISHAAALVTEADMSTSLADGSTTLSRRADGNFWTEGIRRQGTVPWGSDADYKVFRNVVTDYHANSTGASDSTAAIQAVINDGQRWGERCNPSNLKNAIVYFPPGTYLLSTTIRAISWPTIRAASSFVELGVLSTNEYAGGIGLDGGDAEYYVNTARFYSQIRNLRIDITSTDPNAYVCAIHYQVAQATSLQDMKLIATPGQHNKEYVRSPNLATQVDTDNYLVSENGSGGIMSDVTFRGGNFGFYGGNQQFSAHRMTFIGCLMAIQIIWDWGWVWKSLRIQGGEVGIRLVNPDGNGKIGSVSFIDFQITGVTTAIIASPASSSPGSGTTGLILDNTRIGAPIVDTADRTYLGAGYFTTWALGPTYAGGNRLWTSGSAVPYSREQSLLGGRVDGLNNPPYFERKKNQYAQYAQYANRPVGDFVQLKTLGARGDGVSDDTAAIHRAFNQYGDGSRIIFVDAGTYILTDTVTIPKDAKIHGEAWSQFAAFGNSFSDANSPRVMLRVGNRGDVGTVELQDLILTTKGGTAGAMLMEWNVKAASPGTAALWAVTYVHARIGGATGTSLTSSECPCPKERLMLHLTPESSGYFENMWLWVADHMIDDPNLQDAYNDMAQLSVYVARGMLVESTTATWLYETTSEHSIFYQYNFHGARNIFTTMIQTEAPYYQHTPRPPAPFDRQVGIYGSDPNYRCTGGEFDGCDEAWAVIITESQNIHISSAGTYSWFSTYTQSCIDSRNCQRVLWLLNDNHANVRLGLIIAIGAEYILVSDGRGVLSADNLGITAHPAWAQISVFDVPTRGLASSSNRGDTLHKLSLWLN